MPPPKIVSKRCLAAFLAIALTSCSDDESQKKQAPATTAANSAHQEKWLLPGSTIGAAQWLVSRHEPKVRPAHDPEVKRVASDLATANHFYRESERMIANRVAQLEDMLKGIGEPERAIDLLTDLTRVAGEAGQTEGFGAISQHYYNLRSNNIERGEALATLTTRYGSRN